MISKSLSLFTRVNSIETCKIKRQDQGNIDHDLSIISLVELMSTEVNNRSLSMTKLTQLPHAQIRLDPQTTPKHKAPFLRKMPYEISGYKTPEPSLLVSLELPLSKDCYRTF